MKAIRYFVLACMLAGALACQKEAAPESATDPFDFPLEENKDLSTQPGDDFWQYCNGAWYAKAETLAEDAVGGVYDMEPVMAAKVEALVAKVPSLEKYFQLLDEMYDHQEESMAFLASLQAQIKAPQTQEEIFKTLGWLIANGLSPMGLELTTDFKDGKIVGLLSVAKAKLPYQYAFADLSAAVQPQMGWLIEGMGLQPQDVYFNDLGLGLFAPLVNVTAADMPMLIQMALVQLYPFMSEAGLAQYNAYFHEAWSRDDAAAMARSFLGYEVSYYLAQECVPAELKARYKDMLERLRVSFRNRILQLDWMSETTRASALEKLDKMMVFAGSPDVWYEDCLPDLTQCKTLVEAAYLLKCAKGDLIKHLIGTQDVLSVGLTNLAPTATGAITTDLSLVNAYYSREYNSIVILPAMMIPPFIPEACSEAYEYGMLVTAAHEITHGFDTEGSQYDAVGRKTNWWTVADKLAFEDRQEELVRCYGAMEYDPLYPGVFSDGRRTLAENVADLGGFLIARDAYITRLQEQGFSGEHYREQLKKFHEAYAHLHCVKYSAVKLQSIMADDNHSHVRLRINGVVMNTDLWYDLYGVTRDNLLYLPPERRTYIW